MDKVDTRRGATGFTLIELLVVMVIMAMMMAIGVVAFMQIGYAAGLRASVLNVQSTLNQARQNAITYRTRTEFAYSNMESDTQPLVGYYVIRGDDGDLIGATNRLDIGIIFTNPVAGSFIFRLDGSCNAAGFEENITLIERDKGSKALSNSITVYSMSGRVKIKP
ncbi:MAG: prepilin-type N-terminal cleavage/methylation domain-containing protein [bacterium]